MCGIRTLDLALFRLFWGGGQNGTIVVIFLNSKKYFFSLDQLNQDYRWFYQFGSICGYIINIWHSEEVQYEKKDIFYPQIYSIILAYFTKNLMFLLHIFYVYWIKLVFFQCKAKKSPPTKGFSDFFFASRKLLWFILKPLLPHILKTFWKKPLILELLAFSEEAPEVSFFLDAHLKMALSEKPL